MLQARWSLFMQYFLMKDAAQRCLELLDTYDAVGVDWEEPQPGETFTPHFSGNFWCARAGQCSGVLVCSRVRILGAAG